MCFYCILKGLFFTGEGTKTWGLGLFLEDDRPPMLPQFENHVSCLLRFWKR